MERIIWRWMWRFFGVAAALTIVLSVVAGLVLAHLRMKPAPWFGIMVVVMAVLMAAGVLLPGMQHALRRHHAQGGTGPAGGGEKPGAGPGAQ